MKALVFLLAAWWISAGVGRWVLERIHAEARLAPLERFVTASAVGLGLAAYGVLGLGLVGQLNLGAITVWWLMLAVVGLGGMRSNLGEAAVGLRTVRQAIPVSQVVTWEQGVPAAAVLILIACGAATMLACLQPPGGHAWDALAYHLADPKIYLEHHRILPLPTQHHSNFPFTMEMLFTVGLLYNGFALANLFHWLTGVLLVLGILAFCRRYLSSTAGLLAGVILLTTPLIFWEATIAYIDLGLSLYVFLSFSAAHRLIEAPQSGGAATMAGVLMGFALGIKYLALLPFAFVALLLLARRTSWRSILLYAGVAAAVGCPWYVKNIVWMRNPVYPFAFQVFPHSRYWSADRAVPYAQEQQSFGTPHSAGTPVATARNLAITPWRLVADVDTSAGPAPAKAYTNPADFTFTSFIGGLYAGFLFSLAFLRRWPRVVWDVLALCGSLFLAWFLVSQHIRYLIPFLPFAAILAGYAATRWMRLAPDPTPWGSSGPRSASWPMRSVCSAAIGGQALLLFWGVLLLPVSGRSAQEAFQLGLEPTAVSLPEVWADITQPEQRALHLNRLPSYAAAEWIAENTPRDAGVALYEDVHGFYLDRPYLWANGEHSSYIPYDTFQNGIDLTRWMKAHGIGYALFNLNFSPYYGAYAAAGTLIPEDAGAVETLMRQWYGARKPTPGDWRSLVGDAITRGLWSVRYVHHGVAVLEMGEGGS